MQPRVAIIGGTGVGEVLLAQGGQPIHVPTRAGIMRGRIVGLDGIPALVLSRHSAGHKTPPHRVNYAAMALGLRQLGVRWCLASAAVGSLRREWGPGTLIACHDFVDLTGRFGTLYDDTVVHTDFSEPLSHRARQALVEAGVREGLAVQPGGVYVCGNGPRYESPHEIRLMAHVGDIVGMTAASEAILMREAGIGYATLAVVTNLAAGISEEALTHEEVVVEMRRSGQQALAVLTGAARELAEES